MHIYIMRHGPAAEPGQRWADDRQRPLTDEGRAKTREAARGLKALAEGIDVILTSPLVRARETAKIAAEELSLEKKVRETAALEPGFDPRAPIREARSAGAVKGVLLVGHEPDMGAMVSWLLTDQKGAVAVAFKKAAVACIECDTDRGPCGTLAWFATPAMLRAVGRSPE